MTHSKRCWKHLLKDLGLKKSIELLQIFWPLVSDMNLPFPHVSKVVLVWDVTVEAISVQRASCHLQENSLRWFQLHDTVRYVGASNHHKMGTLWTWWDELRCLTMFLSTKGSKVCQGNAPPNHYITITNLHCWYKAEWICDFMLFMPNLNLSYEYCSIYQDSLDQACFLFATCLTLVSLCKLTLPLYQLEAVWIFYFWDHSLRTLEMAVQENPSGPFLFERLTPGRLAPTTLVLK